MPTLHGLKSLGNVVFFWPSFRCDVILFLDEVVDKTDKGTSEDSRITAQCTKVSVGQSNDIMMM